MSDDLYIGMMSGTSMDAIDAALVTISATSIEILATHSDPIEPSLREKILALTVPGEDSVALLGETDVALGRAFANTALTVMKKGNVSPHEVRAIGSHGQTIRHSPYGTHPFSYQIADPNIIAATTSVMTIADFRRRDIALGGQGAPLTPAFHAFMFRHRQQSCFVLNLGGIANLTFIPADLNAPVIGFDTGPANLLIDSWCLAHQQHAYDYQGQWARQGEVVRALLERFIQDEYFHRAIPKSTGREYFHSAWLQKHLDQFANPVTPVDIQATLTELTACSAAMAVHQLAQQQKLEHASIWLCGGGTLNSFLVERLAALCHPFKIRSSNEAGIDPLWVEPVAFAWLAKQTIGAMPGNLPSVTGALRASVLGAVYPV